jgi:hypothetical protein
LIPALLENNNIFPISLGIWLVLILPGLLTLNLICYLLKKLKK